MIIEKKRCCIVVFQPIAVFHIETVVWFASQIMSGFYMECYTGLKWVNFESAKMFLRKFLTGLQIQVKIRSYSGDCDLEKNQLYALRLMAKASGIFNKALAWALC